MWDFFFEFILPFSYSCVCGYVKFIWWSSISPLLENLCSFLTCQEPLWSFSSGRQTGRWSSRSRWRHCRSHRASWGKHQSHFLRGTSCCPWKPLGHNGKTVGEREEKKTEEEFKKEKSKQLVWWRALHLWFLESWPNSVWYYISLLRHKIIW